MAHTIDRLAAADFDELLDFLNMVFDKKPPTDFRNLLPALYEPTDASMRCNFALREDGRIVGNVGVFPVNWSIAGHSLRIAGIGGVATSPDSQGKGIMKSLMTHVVNDVQRSGYQLSYLGGQRQRYAYYGYERCGTELNYEINPSNLKHAFGKGASHGITLRPLGNDDPNLEQLHAWHAAQLSTCSRPMECFHRFLCNWCQLAWRADDEAGRCVGYVIGRLDEGVTPELVARDEEAWVRILRARVEQVSMPVCLPMDALPTSLSLRVAGFAETVSVHGSGNWRIFDWAGVLDALIKARHDAARLPEGRVVVGLRDIGCTLALEVSGSEARCKAADIAIDEADVVLDQMAAMRTLFGPVSPAQASPLPAKAGLLEAWCPLPLAIPRPDHV